MTAGADGERQQAFADTAVLGARAAAALVLPEVVDRGDRVPHDHDELDGSVRATSALRRRVGVWSGLTDAGPLALAGFIANSANVVVTVLLARMLSTRGYGALAQLTSLFLIVSVPGTAVVVGVVRRVTALATSGRAASVRQWAYRNHMRVTVAVVVLALAVFSARGPIAHMLSIPTPLGVFAMVVAGSVWVLLSLDRGLLQAKRRYRVLSVNLVVEGGARTAAVLCLVGAGMGVAGAAWGFLFAEVVTALHARLVADRSWARDSAGRGSLRATVRAGWMRLHKGLSSAEPLAGTRRKERRRLLLDLSGALVAMALLAYLQNVDVIVLGREAPHATGTYAAISVVSKALVFGALALGWYLLPEAAIEWHRGGHALRQLGVTLLILAVPSLTLLFAALAFPRWLLSFVFSARYTGANSALWLLVLAMIFLSTTVVLTTYLLAAGQRWIGALLIVAAVVATVALAAAHGAPHPTALTDLVVQGLLAVSTVVVFVQIHVRRMGRDAADGAVG